MTRDPTPNVATEPGRAPRVLITDTLKSYAAVSFGSCPLTDALE
jgi:hypothetical protein